MLVRQGGQWDQRFRPVQMDVAPASCCAQSYRLSDRISLPPAFFVLTVLLRFPCTKQIGRGLVWS